jgi:hypothetical protein
MAHEPHALQSHRIHLTIDGDQLTWNIRPKGLTMFGVVLLVAGVASLVASGLLAINIWENQEFVLYVRLMGAVSVASTGVSLLTALVFLALRDGWARAVVTFDRDRLTVHEVVLHRSHVQHWSRDELKAISVAHNQRRHELLAALKSAGMMDESALRVESSGRLPQPVLGELSLNGELTWLASILREHLDTPPDAPQSRGDELLVEIDPHLADRGGEVAVPLAGPNGAGWGTVMVPVPAGSSDGAQFPLRGLGPGGGDLPVRLRVREADERAALMESSRHYAWQY